MIGRLWNNLCYQLLDKWHLLLYVLLVAIVAAAMNDTFGNKTEAKPLTGRVPSNPTDRYKIIGEKGYKGCEYVLIQDTYNPWRAIGFAHKGNCKNPYHAEFLISQIEAVLEKYKILLEVED